MVNFKMLLGLALTVILVSPSLHANEFGISDLKYQQIENRVNSMSLQQLNARKSSLLDEEEAINSSSLGSSQKNNRLREIAAELSAIQKAVIAIAGLGAISALTDDGYND